MVRWFIGGVQSFVHKSKIGCLTDAEVLVYIPTLVPWVPNCRSRAMGNEDEDDDSEEES